MADQGGGAMTHGEWQRRYYASPAVWVTMYGEEIDSAYETAEAAQEQVEWDKRQGKRGRDVATITKLHIHTLELARERWSKSTAQ